MPSPSLDRQERDGEEGAVQWPEGKQTTAVGGKLAAM